jgi:hypothetical protein
MNALPGVEAWVKPVPDPLLKKRVLLVVSSRAKRDMRAEAMRKLGIDVDVAIDIDEARYWWRADLYHLVLLDVTNELGVRDRFCQDVREARPSQQLAFLVGAPGYLSDSPAVEELIANMPQSSAEVQPSVSDVAARGKHERWGILEASRRISAVRSMWTARMQAQRNQPVAPRDPEALPMRRRGSQVSAEIRTAMDLVAELRDDAPSPKIDT